MKKDIVLCGVGGDGIVSVAKIISDAALNMGMNLKQSEIHGMCGPAARLQGVKRT